MTDLGFAVAPGTHTLVAIENTMVITFPKLAFVQYYNHIYLEVCANQVIDLKLETHVHVTMLFSTGICIH